MTGDVQDDVHLLPGLGLDGDVWKKNLVPEIPSFAAALEPLGAEDVKYRLDPCGSGGWR